ncbi:MAG: tetratricopeptide repeat-containing serine protease family protein [Phormidium sp.]
MSLGFSRIDSIPGLLAGTATVAALVIYQSAALAAKTPQDIAQFAKLVTVQVNQSSDGRGSGSGVIISKQGNTYTVLTCNHVKNQVGSSPTVRTYDGQSYSAANFQALGNLNNQNEPDLAIFTFTSTADYSVATLGNSDQTTEGADVFVFGYPVQGIYENQTLGADRDFEFTRGAVSSVRRNAQWGYALRYSAVTLGGMSGGPVFDVDGRVVGIHGLGDLSRVQEMVATESGGRSPRATDNVVKTGFNSAIPINTFRQWLEHNGGGSDGVVVDNAPSTDNPQQRLSNPQTANDYTARGVTRSEQGNRQGAIEDFNRAVSLGSNDALTYFNRGVARYNQGDYQGANEDFSQAIGLAPNYAPAYFNRGLARQILKDSQGMLQDYEQYIRLDPKDPAAYNNRASAKAALGDREGAIADLTEALRLAPNLITAYNNRAILRRRLGDRPGAIQDLSEVIRIDPQEASAYYNRGVVRSEVDDRSGALQDLQTAATLFQQQGDNNNYQRVQQKIQSIQAMPDPVQTQEAEPSVDSGESTFESGGTEQPEATDESQQTTPDDSETQEPEPL